MCIYIYNHHRFLPSVQVVSLRNSGKIFISNTGLPKQKNFHEHSVHTINIQMHLTSFWCNQKQSWECTEMMHKLRGLALWNKPAICSSIHMQLLYICIHNYSTQALCKYSTSCICNNSTPVHQSSVHLYWAIQAGLLTPLTFARHRLSPLVAFTSGAYFLHNGRRWQWICEFYTARVKGIFWGP